MTAPASSEKKPIVFMDLPAEIRCMVYKLLAGRQVKVRIPGVEFPPTVIERDTVISHASHQAIYELESRRVSVTGQGRNLGAPILARGNFC
jgi:hypothetical protein